jgi:NAD(P)-dependent dehydrogenase (short-subunit alcohol dehydrogenase family)
MGTVRAVSASVVSGLAGGGAINRMYQFSPRETLMEFGLQNKTAIVTGSTAGIGFATAVGLAREGARVAINGRGKERVESAAQRLIDLVPGAQVIPVAADLGTAEGVASLIELVPDAEILVNNLGIFEPKSFEDIPDADWTRFFEVNVMSGVRLSRYYLPRMKERNWGRILFVSSESAVNIPSEMIHYGMTKTAQVAVARGLAETTVGTGVTVNTVLPGPTGSEGVATFVSQLAQEKGLSNEEMEQEFFAQARPSSLLRRFIEPDEVASLIVYLSSEVAAATNGAAMRVDGGLLRSIL